MDSFYELSMAYNRTTLSPQGRAQMQRVLWHHPSLLGVVDEPKELMVSWQNVDSYDFDFNELPNHIYRLIRLEDGKILGCESYFSDTEESTWLSLAISVGMLDRFFPVEYPLYPKTRNPWFVSIDRIFADIGMEVYRKMTFTVAMIGEENPFPPLDKMHQQLRKNPDLLVPEPLFEQQGVEPRGVRSEGLWWTGGTK